MGVALPPLEFTECLSDSPYFRENLRKHERELEKTNQQIKRIIKEVKDLLAAAKQLSSVQKSFAESLKNFSFECIGGNQTDDEQIICSSLRNLSDLIAQVEEERNRMLESASISVVKPLEDFRKKYIGGVKEEKKKFEKQTAKFCHNQERYLNLTTKKTTTSLQEADASVDMAERCFYAASMDYVCLIQEIHERKKFQFVEVLLTFVYSWFTFYHQGYEVKKDFEPYMKDLQQKIQKTRSNFTDFSAKLKKRMSEVQKQEEPLRHLKGKEGYLYLLEKKAFGTTWTKHYCKYDKESKIFTMLPYNQLTTRTLPQPEAMTLTSCIRRMSESIEKRFCFDIQSDSKPGVVYTFQALSEQDRKAWIDIMDGKEPTYTVPVINKPLNNTEEKYQLDDTGMNFVKKCIEVLESRGLEEQGIYRVVGVTSKVNKLLVMGLDRRKNEKLALEDPQEWETKTITSALKNYLRNLPEPLMTYKYHNSFIAAVKNESRELRVNEVHSLVYRIPKVNFDVLKMIIKHLTKVSSKSDKNLMNVSNLGVCFGPTLLRPEEETVASIMDLKFYNIVVEILIENYDKIFYSEPGRSPPKPALSKNLNGPSQKYNTGHLQPNNHLPTYIDREQDQRYNVGTTYGKINSYKIGENQAYTCNVNPYYEAPITSSMFNVHETLELNDANNVYAMSRSEHRPTFQSRYKLKPTSVSHSETNISNLHSYSPTGFRNYAQLEPHSTSSSNESLSSTSRDGNNFNGATPKKTERSSLYLSYPKGYKSPGNMTLINKPGSLANVTPPRSLSPTNSRVRRVRTLYACLGEHDGELSFEPNQIITNVKTSQEPGWLEGTLNGKTGLIPENYVEVLP